MPVIPTLCLWVEKLSFNAVNSILNSVSSLFIHYSMNRIQFFVLIGLSSLIVLLFIGDVFLVRQTNFEQNRLAAAQQAVNQGQVFQGNLKQLAVRIFQDSQKTQDQGLKDLLVRQQITYNAAPPEGSGNAPEQTVSPNSTAAH
jgi:hypothetical protein